MKKLFIVSAIIIGTLASAGVASAAGYPDWAVEAFLNGRGQA